jgi:hypothetical protein
MRIFRVTMTAAALAAASAAAAQSGWTGLGNRQVSDSVDRDTINVTRPGRWRQMMICVEEAPVRFLEVVVRYRNGGVQNVPVRSLVRVGRCTRDINLRGGSDRDIEAVDFTYEAVSLGGGRARVEVFAR